MGALYVKDGEGTTAATWNPEGDTARPRPGFRALLGGKLLRPDLLGAMTDAPSGPHVSGAT
jgi:hypothetical protein